MLILVAVGDNGRITNAYTRCSRITNPTERIREIRVIRGLAELMGALQMLILVAVGLQIRLSGAASLFTTHYSLFTIHY